MKEIPYLELKKDTNYYLIFPGAVLPPNEFIVQFVSYTIVSIDYNSEVVFDLFYNGAIIKEATVSFANFEVGDAHIYSVTDEELKILKIK